MTTEDTRSMRERMLAGDLHIADDPQLAANSDRAQRLTHRFNTVDPTDHDGRRAVLTATHPLEPGPRRDKWEAAEPITIGDKVWLGGRVVVRPGVTIGADTVVGAGPVVTADLPAGVLALGSPARVIRAL